MLVAVLLVAAVAAADARASSEHVRDVLLAVNEEAAAQAGAPQPAGPDGKIEHAPLEKTPRGEAVSIQAKVPAPGQSAWTLTLFLGGERSHEAYTESVSQGRLGIEGTHRFAGNWVAAVSGDWRFSQQQYAPSDGPPGSRATVDENRIEFSALIGQDLGDLLASRDRLELTPVIGAQAIFARNDGFPFDLFGPSAGLRASWTIAPFTLLASGTYTFNMSKDSGSNVSGAPVSAWGLRAGVQLRLGPASTVELDYVGNGIEFENDLRVAHGGVLGFSKGF